MEQNKRISELFELARNEAPTTSFNELKGEFLTHLAAGGAGMAGATIAQKSLWTKWLAASFKLKVIIMTTVVSVLTISGIVIGTQLTSNSSVEQKRTDNLPAETIEIIEVRSENGIEKTIVYNDKNEVMTVSIDSSEEAKSSAQRIKLNPKHVQIVENAKLSDKVLIDAKPKLTTKSSATDSLTMKKFEINERTSDQEILKMKEQAIAAGMEFTFDTKKRNNKIKRLTLNMSKNGSKWMSKISGTDSFSFEFGWWEDANGKFVKFLCDEDLEIACGDC